MNKSDFPLLKNNPELIYFDNAATTQKPSVVIDIIAEYYENINANVHRGIYRLSEEATSAFEEARETVARFVNAKDEEVIFTSGTTNSLNTVALSLEKYFDDLSSKDTILATEMEHHSNLLPFQQLARSKQARFELVKIDKKFRLDLEDLKNTLKEKNVKVFALTHMSNVLGTVNPLKEIVSLVRKHSKNTLIVVDAAQSVAHLPIDFKDLDIDFMAFSGHKLLAPNGIGVLIGKKKLLESMEPVQLGGGMIEKVEQHKSSWTDIPYKFEAGTPNISGAIGLSEAIKYVQSIGFEKIAQHEDLLKQYFLKNAQDFTGLDLHGPSDMDMRGTVFSFSLQGAHPHDLAQVLDEKDVAVRAGHHCNQILMRKILGISASTRASLYFYNEIEEIDAFFDKLKEAENTFK